MERECVFGLASDKYNEVCKNVEILQSIAGKDVPLNMIIDSSHGLIIQSIDEKKHRSVLNLRIPIEEFIEFKFYKSSPIEFAFYGTKLFTKVFAKGVSNQLFIITPSTIQCIDKLGKKEFKKLDVVEKPILFNRTNDVFQMDVDIKQFANDLKNIHAHIECSDVTFKLSDTIEMTGESDIGIESYNYDIPMSHPFDNYLITTDLELLNKVIGKCKMLSISKTSLCFPQIITKVCDVFIIEMHLKHCNHSTLQFCVTLQN